MIIIIALVVLLVIGTGSFSLWDRFRHDDEPIKEWMLKLEGLDGLCRDYLDYIKQMKSGRYDLETIRYLDSQRQVTHDQLLAYLELDRSDDFDMEQFAKRYLAR